MIRYASFHVPKPASQHHSAQLARTGGKSWVVHFNAPSSTRNWSPLDTAAVLLLLKQVFSFDGKRTWLDAQATPRLAPRPSSTGSSKDMVVRTKPTGNKRADLQGANRQKLAAFVWCLQALDSVCHPSPAPQEPRSVPAPKGFASQLPPDTELPERRELGSRRAADAWSSRTASEAATETQSGISEPEHGFQEPVSASNEEPAHAASQYAYPLEVYQRMLDATPAAAGPRHAYEAYELALNTPPVGEAELPAAPLPVNVEDPQVLAQYANALAAPPAAGLVVAGAMGAASDLSPPPAA